VASTGSTFTEGALERPAQFWVPGAKSLQGGWIAACAVTLVERIFTFAFFIPKAIGLMRDDALSTTTALHTATRWHSLNWLRLLLSFIGWLLALLAYGAR